MRLLILGILLACVAGVAGCVSNSSATSATMQAGHAECLVCKKNVDLACVDVKVEQQTPTAQYNGKTYYFCSDDCKALFEKNPENLAAK